MAATKNQTAKMQRMQRRPAWYSLSSCQS